MRVVPKKTFRLLCFRFPSVLCFFPPATEKNTLSVFADGLGIVVVGKLPIEHRTKKMITRPGDETQLKRGDSDNTLYVNRGSLLDWIFWTLNSPDCRLRSDGNGRSRCVLAESLDWGRLRKRGL